jgi:hypothetical protein
VKSNVPDLTVVSGNPARPVWKVEPPPGWEPSEPAPPKSAPEAAASG